MLHRFLPLVVAAVSLGTSLPPATVGAQSWEEAERCVDALDDHEVTERMEWVERRFLEDRPRAQRWLWSWTAINAASLGLSVGFAYWSRDNPAERDANIIGAAGAGLTLLMMYVPLLEPAYALGQLESLPDSTPAERRRRLRDGIRRLRRSAKQERVNTGAINYVLATAFAVGQGLYVGLRYDDWTTAGINSAGTLAMAYAQILSAPQDAIEAEEVFLANHHPCGSASASHPIRVRASVAPMPRGIGLRLRF